MNNATKAAEDIKSFLSKFKWLQDVADTLDGIGNLEQAKRDGEIKKSEISGEIDRLNKILDDKKKEVLSCDLLIKDSKEKADEIISNATSSASLLIEKTQAESFVMIDSLGKKKLSIETEITYGQGVLSGLNTEIDSARATLQKIKQEIESAKAKIHNIV